MQTQSARIGWRVRNVDTAEEGTVLSECGDKSYYVELDGSKLGDASDYWRKDRVRLICPPRHEPAMSKDRPIDRIHRAWEASGNDVDDVNTYPG